MMNKIIFPLVIAVFSIFLIILIINTQKNNNLIKHLFVIFFLFSLIAILVYEESFVDQVLYYIIQYIYYPTYFSCILSLLIGVILFIYTLLNNKLSYSYRIFNYGIFVSIFVSYIVFLIIGVDILDLKSLYTGGSLICLRLISRSLIIWLIFTLLIKYYNYFVKRW